MSEWKCASCGVINTGNKEKCQLCGTPKMSLEEIAQKKAEKEKAFQDFLEDAIVSKEPVHSKWEYCLISSMIDVQSRASLLPFITRTEQKEQAYIRVYGREPVNCKFEQIPDIVVLLGDNGWEFVTSTESTITFEAGYLAIMITLYFKRAKSSQ